MVLRFLEPKLHCLSRFLGKITAAGSHPRNFKIRIVWDPDLLPMNPCDVVPEVGGSIKMKIQRSPAPKEDCHGCKGPHIFSNLYISNFIIFHKILRCFRFCSIISSYRYQTFCIPAAAPVNLVGSFNSWMLSSGIAGMKSLGVTIKNTHGSMQSPKLGTEAPDASVLINHVKPTARQIFHAIVGWNAKKTNNICPKISSCTRIQPLK